MKNKINWSAQKPMWVMMGVMLLAVAIAALLAVFVPYGWIGSIIVAIAFGVYIVRYLIPKTIHDTHEKLDE